MTHPAVTPMLGPGELIVFTPETAHAPMIGSGEQRKAVFKIKCN